MKTKTIMKLTLAAALCLGASKSQAQITNGLVVHLAFDGTNVSGAYTNSFANGIDASPVGAPTQGPGKLGKCVALTVDGTLGLNNYLTLGYPPELQFGSVTAATATDFSISFWVNYTNQASDPAFIASQNWASSNNKGWGLYMQGSGNTRIVTVDRDGGVAHRTQTTVGNPDGLLKDGKWHHVVVTWARAGNMSVYKDGALVAAVSLSGTQGDIDPYDLGNTINIGQDGTGLYQSTSFNYSNLLMDDMGIWRRELSAGEVNQIYAYGSGGTNILSVPTIANPYVKSTFPALGTAGVSPLAPVGAIITDGTNALNSASVHLYVNSVEVPVTITKTPPNSTVTYTPAAIWPAGLNTATLVFANAGSPVVSKTNTWTYSVAPVATLTPSMKVTPDVSKPGFKWNIFANQANTTAKNARTEQALAGLLKDVDGITPLANLADPSVKGAALATATPPSPANAPISFEIAGPLDLDTAATGSSTNGNFGPDGQIPGLPATDTSANGAAAEAITYVNLPAGLVTMGVNSDDGFRTTAGLVPQDVVGSIRAGEFDGARGSADTIFYLYVQEHQVL